MIVTRRVTFRLYPSKAQAVKMLETRRLHAYLYNACVEHRSYELPEVWKGCRLLDSASSNSAIQGLLD